MKTIGILGGMTWQSSQAYYNLINREVEKRLGGCSSAQVVMYSVNFQPIADMQAAGHWREMGEILAEHAVQLQNAGADFILLATNTMHLVADQLKARLDIPILNLIELAAERAAQDGFTKIGLLGTKFTMESELYPSVFNQRGLQIITPEEGERAVVNNVIYTKLANGVTDQEDREAYLKIIDGLVEKGAQTVILGCTEIGMLVRPQDTSVKLIDTTPLHCLEAVNLALS